jgi:hypothetical protein
MRVHAAKRLLIVLLPIWILQGCIANDVLLQVMPDGQGRAVITSRIYEPALHAYDSLFAEVPRHARTEDQLPAPLGGELTRQFGTPVTLVSTKLDQVVDGVVRTTIVEFPDIAKLRIGFPPVFALPSGGMFDISGFSENPVISFAMARHDNGDRLLLVKLPDERIDTAAEPQMTVFETDSREERIFKRAIQRMALRMFVELDGLPLLRTNAPASKGNRVTILDLDLDKIINGLDEAKLRRAMTPGSMQEVLWQLGDMPGAVVPAEHEVFLEFEPPQGVPQTSPAPQPSAQAPPDTEIFLARLKLTNGTLELGTPINITNNPGYDNQPFFTPDGKSVLFTSVRGAAPGASGGSLTQTDIYRYDIAAQSVARVTQTPEGEYSPTAMLDGSRISVIRVEADGTQRLASIAPSGPKIQVDVILPDVKPVGYHAWADDRTVAMFILGGNGAPATLQVGDTRSGKARVVATDIGRSLQRMPGTGAARHISFVQRTREGETVSLTIKELDPASGEITTLTPAVAGAREADIAWTPDGTLLMVKDNVLYGWKRGQSGWKEVASLSRLSLYGATRLAVSPAGDYLALVGSASQPR